ncbi:MAG: hypothetical protein V1837_07145 [Candidatus Woesearchaeota archaeon]
MAKAQMEVMGLVVVIILLTIGLLLIVQFVVLKEPTQLKQRQSESQLAANFISTLLQTSTACSNYQISSLIQNCATRNDITCSGQSACKYVNQTISFIVNQTLVSWHKSFNLTVSGTSDTFPPRGIVFTRGDCTGTKESKFYAIHAGSKTVIVNLDICT